MGPGGRVTQRSRGIRLLGAAFPRTSSKPRPERRRGGSVSAVAGLHNPWRSETRVAPEAGATSRPGMAECGLLGTWSPRPVGGGSGASCTHIFLLPPFFPLERRLFLPCGRDEIRRGMRGQPGGRRDASGGGPWGAGEGEAHHSHASPFLCCGDHRRELKRSMRWRGRRVCGGGGGGEGEPFASCQTQHQTPSGMSGLPTSHRGVERQQRAAEHAALLEFSASSRDLRLSLPFR